MAHNSEPREVVEVLFPGGGSGRMALEDALAIGIQIVREESLSPATESRKTRGRKAKPSLEADENTD